MGYKIDWVSIHLEGQFKKKRAFLLCFILYLRAISKYKHTGTYIRRGDLMEGYEFGARIWRAKIWRGLFSEFYGNRCIFDFLFKGTLPESRRIRAYSVGP